MMLEDFGLEPERFRIEWIASAEAQKFADVMTEMTEAITGPGPEPVQHERINNVEGRPFEPPLHVFRGEAENNDHTIGQKSRRQKIHVGRRVLRQRRAAQQVMEDYAKDGFEVQKFVDEAGQFLVYSRRVATVDKSGE